MSLIRDLKKDLSEALKSREDNKVETLRGLLADIHNEEIKKRSEGKEENLSDEEVLSVLQKEAKKRREAAEIYNSAGRSELEKKEKDELEVIESYLPPPMSEDELNRVVMKVVSGGEDNFGKVMGAVMKEVKGRADSKLVSEVVKKHLSGGE